MIKIKKVSPIRSTALRLAVCVGLVAFVAVAIAPDAAAQKSKASRKLNVSKRAHAKARAQKASMEVREAEQLLNDLGYWTGPIDGRMDTASRHALIAFQKVEGRKRTGRLTTDELDALRSAHRPTPRDKSYAHIEIDLERQVLFVIGDTGKVTKVLPVSTGNGKEFTSEGWTRDAITPKGRFKVHNKIKGWRKSPLGMIYYPVYFLSGIAIHGYSSVPVTAASHGCVRIPIFAAKEFYDMIPIGMYVIVHDGQPSGREQDPAAQR
jgi:N-acetylmuramoyl-L-alanine amidase